MTSLEFVNSQKGGFLFGRNSAQLRQVFSIGQAPAALIIRTIGPEFFIIILSERSNIREWGAKGQVNIGKAIMVKWLEGIYHRHYISKVIRR